MFTHLAHAVKGPTNGLESSYSHYLMCKRSECSGETVQMHTGLSEQWLIVNVRSINISRTGTRYRTTVLEQCSHRVAVSVDECIK